MRRKLCFEIGQLGNMDEVSLTFDVPLNKTVDVKGVKTIMIKTSGNEKTRYTVVLACCADGTKLPPLLNFKRKMLPKDVIPNGIYIHVHSKGWMDGWRRNEAVVRESVVQASRWSSCNRFKKRLATKLKMHLAVIPGGLTSQLQPLDISVNKPFKRFMHEEWAKWIEAPTHHVTPAGRMRWPSISNVCEWVKNSWQ